MSNEVTIDELRIEIEAESGTAASNLDDLAKSLDRLQAVTQRMTGGGDGLNKVAKQIEKLNAISQKIQSMQGFEKLERAVDQLKKLNELNGIGDISGFVRNLNKLPQAVNAIAQMPSIDTAKFQQIADALKPLETVSAGNLNSLLNSLRKLPKASQELSGVDLTRFASQIDRISRAIEPLTRQAERGGAGLTALAQIMQSTSRQARQSSGGVSLFNQTIGNIKVKTLAAIAGLRRLFSELKKGVTASAAYVENLNLFSVTMGESTGEALKFAEAVNDALGVDTSDWIRYQGVFQSIGKGFGIASEKADVMSKNLTQLTYDISSFYNISADMAGEKLQSALSGQVMPMRQLGFAIEETTLKQVALNHGIKMSVENMTQAQKAQLRYIAIMEQAGNIGVLGDMARTIDTAANGMRVFTARLQQFARAVGNMVMPVLSAVLPYATAFVQVITEAAQSIADFFGFELPKIDFSGASVSSGFDDITSSVDDATKANEKFKGSLSSIDQLNIIGSKDEGKSSAGGENQFDLGIELPEYDFLQGVESQTNKIVEDIKAALPWIEALGAAIGTVFIAKKVYDLIDALPKLGKAFQTVGGLIKGDFGSAGKIFSGIAGGLAAGAASGILLNNGIKNLITGTGKLGGNIAKVASGAVIAGGAIALFIKLGNPLGAVITGIGAAIGIVSGYLSGIKEAAEQRAMEEITAAFESGVTPITEVADALERVAADLTSNEQDYLNRKESLKGISDNAKTTGDNIKSMLDELALMETIDPTVTDNLKKAFEDLATTSKQYIDESNNNFKLYILANQDMLKAQGFNVSSMVEIINQGTQSAKDTIDDLTTKAKELTDKQLSVGLNTDEIGQLEKINTQLLEMSGVEIDFGVDVSEAKNVLEGLSSIKFTDAETAASGLQRAFDAVSTAYSTLDTARAGMLDDVERLSATGNLSAVESETLTNAVNSIFDAKKLELDQAFSDPMNTIIRNANGLNANIEASVARATADAVEGAGIFGLFNADVRASVGGKSYEEINAEKVKNILGDNASLIQNPLDNLYASFAEKGLNPDVVDNMLKTGKDLTKGIANGISEGTPKVTDAMNGVTAAAENAFRSATETHSPSRVYTRLGGYLMQGLSNGIIDGLPDVLKTFDDISAAIFNRTKGLRISVPAFNTNNSAIDMDMNTVYEKVQKANASLSSSYKLPAGAASAVAVGGIVGSAREAVSNATQGAVQGSAVAAEFVIHNYTTLDVDGDTIAESVSQAQQRQMAYSNGR